MEVSSTTKEIKVLEGVCAYVEVRSKCENRSNVIAEELRKLGAQINDKLNVNVTHVVFKDGTNRTLERAKKLDIPLVSVLWVDSCKKTLEHVCENAFPVESPNKDQEERLFPTKKRKQRSMQPKDLNVEFEESSQRCHRRRKRTDKNKTGQQSSYFTESMISPNMAFSFDNMPHIKTPPSMKAKLLERSQHKEKESSFVKEDTSDLKRKLFHSTSDITSFCIPPQPPQPTHSHSSSSISSQESISEILPHNSSLGIPCATNLKNSRKSFGIVSDLKSSSAYISNGKKRLKVNEQRTTFVQSFLEQTEKEKTLCDSTSNRHSDSSSPLSAITTNTSNRSMDDFIITKPVPRKRHKHRETLNILGLAENSLNSITHSVCDSEKIKKADMSKDQHPENSTFTQTLSSSKVELMTCHKKLKKNGGAPFCSTPIDNKNGCTESNVEKRLEQQPLNNLDNLSQSSYQSVAYPLNQTASLLLPLESENQGLCLSIAKEKRKMFPFQRPIKKYLVMTSMSSSEQEMVKSVAKALGGSVISDHVRKSTTHVICGNARRTLNLLYGLIQGCWVVSKQWVLKSMEAGHWVDERKFEMTDDYPASKVYRQNKQKSHSLPVFKNCGPVFISTSTAPPRKDLAHFIQFCGGQVKNNMSDADFYVGDEYNPSMLSVSPQWILDSITHQKVCPFENYQLGQPKPQSPDY